MHGIQTSVLDFCQPVMTLAVLTFPCWAVPADNTTLYEMVKIESEREIVGITVMSNIYLKAARINIFG